MAGFNPENSNSLKYTLFSRLSILCVGVITPRRAFLGVLPAPDRACHVRQCVVVDEVLDENHSNLVSERSIFSLESHEIA